jgi:competence protein ComEC
MKHINFTLNYFFDKEPDRIFLWLPVIIGAGIVFYHSVIFEPSYYQIISAVVISFAVILITHRRFKQAYIPLLILPIFFTGVLLAKIETDFSNTNFIEDDLGTIWVRGDIVEVETKGNGARIYLNNLDFWQPEIGNFSEDEIPKKIRVNIRTDLAGAEAGDRVSFKAILSKPKRPVYPNDYDFQKYAYFNQVGAVGFALSDLEIMQKAEVTNIQKMRKAISKNIAEVTGDKNIAAIGSALINADVSAISRETMEDMRASGLGHLLAVSGLNMVIVMSGFFFLVRGVLSLIPKIALNYNIKKFAAILAIFIGFFYLLITDMPVSAVRAYIMAFLFFFAIIIDRLNTPMRPVALSALIILVTSPHAAITPSFQMSFGAVIALIGFYEFIKKEDKILEERDLLGKIAFYFFMIFITSIVAGIVTLPFSLYHFGRLSTYGFFANLLAIPLTSFWVMPFAFISAALIPFGLHAIPAKIMASGVELLTWIANYFASLENATSSFSNFSGWVLAISTIAALWLLFWKTKIRYYAIPIILICYVIIFLPRTTPNLIVNEKGNLFAVRGDNGEYYFSSFRKGRYEREQWLQSVGKITAKKIDELETAKCQDNICKIYENKNFKETTYIIITSDAENFTCPENISMPIINLSEKNYPCQTINLENLSKFGTHIFFGNKITNVEDQRGKRPWVF